MKKILEFNIDIHVYLYLCFQAFKFYAFPILYSYDSIKKVIISILNMILNIMEILRYKNSIEINYFVKIVYNYLAHGRSMVIFRFPCD